VKGEKNVRRKEERERERERDGEGKKKKSLTFLSVRLPFEQRLKEIERLHFPTKRLRRRSSVLRSSPLFPKHNNSELHIERFEFEFPLLLERK
jgi:hypothetical protein